MRSPFALGGLLLLCAVTGAQSQEDGLTWLSSYPEALAQARATGKPIFLEFRCEP